MQRVIALASKGTAKTPLLAIGLLARLEAIVERVFEAVEVGFHDLLQKRFMK